MMVYIVAENEVKVMSLHGLCKQFRIDFDPKESQKKLWARVSQIWLRPLNKAEHAAARVVEYLEGIEDSNLIFDMAGHTSVDAYTADIINSGGSTVVHNAVKRYLKQRFKEEFKRRGIK